MAGQGHSIGAFIGGFIGAIVGLIIIGIKFDKKTENSTTPDGQTSDTRNES
jgi:hypothetical protein